MTQEVTAYADSNLGLHYSSQAAELASRRIEYDKWYQTMYSEARTWDEIKERINSWAQQLRDSNNDGPQT